MTNQFGQRLRSARHAAGLTQRELAHGIMSASQLSLLESGKRRPSQQSIAALAQRLGLPPTALAPGLALVWRPRVECRLEQARTALRHCNYATAERLATQVICSGTYAERRMRAYCLRAEAREAMRQPRAALADLDAAFAIAEHRRNSSAFVDIAFSRARLRHQLHSDDAA